MSESQLSGLLYAFSLVAMLLALISARCHGDASRKKEAFNERLYEFARNAFIQFSAMLFALATAEYVYVKTSDRQLNEARTLAQTKEEEQKKAVQLSASAIIVDRATTIKRAMRRFEFRNKPEIMPGCLEDVLPTEYDIVFKDYVLDDTCALQVNDSIKSLLENKESIEGQMKLIVESFKVTEDWAKSNYFSGRIDPEVLHDFESTEDKLDYRQFLIHVLIEKLDKNKHPGVAQYDDIRYVSYIDLALRNFQKSLFIYLMDFYITFGDLSLSSEDIRNKERNFINMVKSETQEEKLMNLSSFRKFLEDRLDNCSFENIKCNLLIDHFEIDRSILTP